MSIVQVCWISSLQSFCHRLGWNLVLICPAHERDVVWRHKVGGHPTQRDVTLDNDGTCLHVGCWADRPALIQNPRPQKLGRVYLCTNSTGRTLPGERRVRNSGCRVAPSSGFNSKRSNNWNRDTLTMSVLCLQYICKKTQYCLRISTTTMLTYIKTEADDWRLWTEIQVLSGNNWAQIM